MLAACGGQRSTLPPAPGASGAVALTDLAHSPEVYADASVSTTGTVALVHVHADHAGGREIALYVLDGGHGARIVLEPSANAARDLGRRVRVSGLFTVSFAIGYEILISHIATAGTL